MIPRLTKTSRKAVAANHSPRERPIGKASRTQAKVPPSQGQTRADPLLAAEQVGADELTDARREQVVRGEAGHQHGEEAEERDRLRRGQDALPAPGAQEVAADAAEGGREEVAVGGAAEGG